MEYAIALEIDCRSFPVQTIFGESVFFCIEGLILRPFIHSNHIMLAAMCIIFALFFLYYFILAHLSLILLSLNTSARAHNRVRMYARLPEFKCLQSKIIILPKKKIKFIITCNHFHLAFVLNFFLLLLFSFLNI